MEIRPITDADVTDVIALWDRCRLLRPWNDPQADIRFARDTASSEIFVGMVDGMLGAAIMCGHDGHRGWIYYLAIDPDLQGRQYGRAIMAHAEEWLLGLGVPKVELMIRETNRTVAAFYQALGYDTEPVVTMSRWLKQPKGLPDG